MIYWTSPGMQDWMASATQSRSLRGSLRFQSNFVKSNKNFKRINKHRNSPLWCKQLLGHLPVHERDQNLTLCIPSYYWWGYYEQLDLDGHNPYLTNTSCQMRSLEACLLAGWLWTGHHVSGKHLKCHCHRRQYSEIVHVPSCTEILIKTLEAPQVKSSWVRGLDLNATHGTTLGIIFQSAEGREQIFKSDKNSFFPILAVINTLVFYMGPVWNWHINLSFARSWD